MVAYPLSHGIGWGLDSVPLEDRANALEEMADDCGASMGLDLLALACGVNPSFHYMVD